MPILTAGRAKRTEVLHGTEDVLDEEVRFFSNTKRRIDTCMNYTRPPLAVGIGQIKKAFLDAKSRGVRLRYLTEITNENISYCKELIKIVDELRHLDAIKGNFMISEGEYLAPVNLDEEGKIASQLIYSNVDEIVEQQNYIFETLWSRAIPSERRITEIEENKTVPRTEVLYGAENAVGRGVQFMKNAKKKMDIFFDSKAPSIVIEIDAYRNGYMDIRKGGGKIRAFTEITKDNIHYCKELIKIVDELRHLDGIKGGIAINETEYMATTVLQEAKPLTQVIYSNMKEVVDQGQYIFDIFWYRAIPAEQKIREIEDGIEPSRIEVIPDTKVSISRSLALIKSAVEEVLVIFATSETFSLAMNMGILQLYKEVTQNGAKIRLLIPDSQQSQWIVNELKSVVPQVDVRIADKSLQTRITILVVDKTELMIWELKDDSLEDPYKAGGVATYSNNKSIASSYASIFENLWKQTELYQKLKEADKIKDEFINVAAHELRTPIQPILGLADILRTKLRDGKQEKEYLDVIIRNAKRLQRLSEDILDITKIESKSLGLKKELFNLSEVLLNAIADSNNQIVKENKDHQLRLQLVAPEEDIFMEADKGRINQVISNLLSNAIKFTGEGSIILTLEKKDNNQEIRVSIQDTGTGIHPEILPRLFTKFATKSEIGTGLGLFISKSIVEAHGGKIWAENNPGGNGTTFTFGLPLNF
ncbi:MAG: HAMP domain-containing histidine kinase [Thermoproteota archaeon]|nr:HAMP domain-containing histidine kinase [Thermoproteota archaeon]